MSANLKSTLQVSVDMEMALWLRDLSMSTNKTVPQIVREILDKAKKENP